MFDGSYDEFEGTITFHDDFPSDSVNQISIRFEVPINRRKLVQAVILRLKEISVTGEIILSFDQDFDETSKWKRIKACAKQLWENAWR